MNFIFSNNSRVKYLNLEMKTVPSSTSSLFFVSSEQKSIKSTYPTACLLVHILLHFASISNQVSHALIPQGCLIRGGKYCVHPEKQETRTTILSIISWQNYQQCLTYISHEIIFTLEAKTAIKVM